MSEPRKNHLTIDGGQVKEDEHVDSYKPVPESDTEFRPSKQQSKSKERVSDEAEEKLLQKEDEAKITTRVDMADAKYVVGDHRNGDAKIELDANKRQFSGLTKEELLKYVDDPFWVRLRWFMFVLFWLLWLCMLAGAIAIIVHAPKCAPPADKAWYEEGPLADWSSDKAVDYAELEADLPLLEQAKVQGVFINPCETTYEILDTPTCIDHFKAFVEKAKARSIKVIVDLTANFVSTSHQWFERSENRSQGYDNYFIWAKGTDFDPDTNRPKVPNNWLSTQDGSAWTWSDVRNEYYLHQYGADQPDLNLTNPAVAAHFGDVLGRWMKAGAAGVRLLKARQLVVNSNLLDEQLDTKSGASHGQYLSLLHKLTRDQPELHALFEHWAHVVATNGTGDTVFTLAEDGRLGVEWHQLEGGWRALRPPSAAPLQVLGDMASLATRLNHTLGQWPAKEHTPWRALKLVAPSPGEAEVARLLLVLPAAPLLAPDQLIPHDNDTAATEMLSYLSELRSDASIQHGELALQAVPAVNSSARLLAAARWKSGHTGYAAVYNPQSVSARANLTSLPALPDTLAVHHVSRSTRLDTNYTNNLSVPSDNVLVPPLSTVVLSYVPRTTVEE